MFSGSLTFVITLRRLNESGGTEDAVYDYRRCLSTTNVYVRMSPAASSSAFPRRVSSFAVTFTIQSLSSIPRSIRTAKKFPSRDAAPPIHVCSSRPPAPRAPGRTAVGTSPANRRLRFTTGSSYFYERHSTAKISSLVSPRAGNARLKIFPGMRARCGGDGGGVVVGATITGEHDGK